MPGGSKKGERRGNARKRGSPHEKPRDIIEETISHSPKKQGDRGLGIEKVERRIQIARIIHGHSSSVLDMVPKDVMLAAMRYSMQAVSDWVDYLAQVSSLPPSEANNRLVAHAESEIERLYDKAGDHAFKLAPYIHPRLSAVAIAAGQGDSPASVMQQLLDELDERQRAEPMLIEHRPSKKTA